MNSIPFLRFPSLVIQEVLRTMCPFELIHLSMTSKKTKQILTIVSKPKFKNKFEIYAYINKDYGVTMKNGQMTWGYRFVSLAHRDGRNEFNNKEQIRKYTKNKLEGFKTICDCIQDVFGLKFNKFLLSMEKDHNQNRLTVDYLKIRQEIYTRFELRSVSGNDEDIKYLFDNLKFSDFLKIESGITEDVQIDLPENVDYLWVDDAKFVNLEQLLKLKCGCIQLDEISLTERDINAFLKSWIALESNLNLVYFKIGFKFRRMDGILQDIPYEIGGSQHFQKSPMDPPPDPPRIPEGFLQFSTKHEYFKRNSAVEAHRNVCQMINSQLTRRPELQLPDLEPEFQEDDDPPPAKKLRTSQPGPTSYRRMKSVQPDSDSDSSNINYPMFDNPEDEEDDGQCTLNKTKWLYEKLAEKELEVYGKKGMDITGKELREILFIQRITTAPTSSSISRPIQTFKTIVGYRKISMTIFSKTPTSISYHSSQEGCLVWYGDVLKIEHNLKYQSLAARDYIYLVEDPKTEFEELEIDIEEGSSEMRSSSLAVPLILRKKSINIGGFGREIFEFRGSF